MSLTTLLKKHNISGYSLSKKTGISQSTIASWVNGTRPILGMSLKKAILICDTLNIDLNTLYEELSEK